MHLSRRWPSSQRGRPAGLGPMRPLFIFGSAHRMSPDPRFLSVPRMGDSPPWSAYILLRVTRPPAPLFPLPCRHLCALYVYVLVVIGLCLFAACSTTVSAVSRVPSDSVPDRLPHRTHTPLSHTAQVRPPIPSRPHPTRLAARRAAPLALLAYRIPHPGSSRILSITNYHNPDHFSCRQRKHAFPPPSLVLPHLSSTVSLGLCAGVCSTVTSRRFPLQNAPDCVRVHLRCHRLGMGCLAPKEYTACDQFRNCL